MTTKLKPCPFCGGSNPRLEGMSNRYVRCGNEGCDAMGPSEANDRPAVAAWNAAPRRDDVPVAVAVEQETLHDKYTRSALTGLLASGPNDCRFDELIYDSRTFADAAMKARGT